MSPRKWLFKNPLKQWGLDIVLWTAIMIVSGGSLGAEAYIARCDVDSFRQHLTRVCAIYSKRSTEFHMRPLTHDHRKPSDEFEKLWGYYLREWEASQGSATESVGLLYQISQDGNNNMTPLPYLLGEKYKDPNSDPLISTHPQKVDNADHGESYTFHIRVLPTTADDQNGDKSSDFARWRRNAMLKDLVVKCCSPSGCKPGDFVAVAHEYSICPGGGYKDRVFKI